ncbi:MAG: hypothetical protein ACFHVJ_15425 [Aestuariibacter sp.]
MINKIVTQLLLCLVFSVGYVQATEIINAYPNCQAGQAESITFKKELLSKNGIVSYAEKEKTFKFMRDQLIQKGRDKAADAIILTDKRVIMPKSRRTGIEADGDLYLSLAAELINYCDDDRSLSTNPAPFNREGSKILQLGGFSREAMSFTMSQPGEARAEQVSGLSNVISLQNGIYGIKLGDSTETVKNQFGFPSAQFNLSDSHILFAYGRAHWLYFQQDKLIAVTTENPWFNQNLLNLIPFDDYFDSKEWILFGEHKSGSVLSQSAVRQSGNQQLSSSGYKISDVEFKLQGFNYKRRQTNFPSLSALASEGNYEWIAETVLNGKQSAATLNKLVTDAAGSIYNDRVSVTHIYDQFLRVETITQEIKEIIIGDSFFKDVETANKWSFGMFSKDMSIEDCRKILPGDTQQVGDTLLVVTESNQLEFQFYEERGRLMLYQIKLKGFG